MLPHRLRHRVVAVEASFDQPERPRRRRGIERARQQIPNKAQIIGACFTAAALVCNNRYLRLRARPGS